MDKFILATSSPRRRMLFDKFNIDYVAIESDINEHLDSTDTPLQYTMSLAFSKAYNVAKSFEKDIVIVAIGIKLSLVYAL